MLKSTNFSIYRKSSQIGSGRFFKSYRPPPGRGEGRVGVASFPISLDLSKPLPLKALITLTLILSPQRERKRFDDQSCNKQLFNLPAKAVRKF
jgi:hypothetical protein